LSAKQTIQLKYKLKKVPKIIKQNCNQLNKNSKKKIKLVKRIITRMMKMKMRMIMIMIRKVNKKKLKLLTQRIIMIKIIKTMRKITSTFILIVGTITLFKTIMMITVMITMMAIMMKRTMKNL
jgi:hypothetical protein